MQEFREAVQDAVDAGPGFGVIRGSGGEADRGIDSGLLAQERGIEGGELPQKLAEGHHITLMLMGGSIAGRG
jgi:hypothetical protein